MFCCRDDGCLIVVLHWPGSVQGACILWSWLCNARTVHFSSGKYKVNAWRTIPGLHRSAFFSSVAWRTLFSHVHVSIPCLSALYILLVCIVQKWMTRARRRYTMLTTGPFVAVWIVARRVCRDVLGYQAQTFLSSSNRNGEDRYSCPSWDVSFAKRGKEIYNTAMVSQTPLFIWKEGPNYQGCPRRNNNVAKQQQ